ncbi:MAG: ABC transporter ATP-binding protein [Bryobacterales bacterium]|nr:ABC transporter ATP-binding protein [Bryobacteraceae bacterium]MDW8353993.1 ABC transporter ATP-binding protein [Bryobacterales bacterium]
MDIVVLENVSKLYSRRRSRQFLRTYLAHWFRRPRAVEAFYALRGISFRLREGDSLGVVGPNGAGKTTLLSLIAGLTFPEEGAVHVRGRVAALLELGSGFHPDLTGAENVMVNAALLGLSRQEARARFDEIVEFSGIGDFIDEPLRTYSSGMVMRLAFSVAMNVRPDVLLIDEVLAVGDQEFQAKCLERILRLKRAGKVLVCTSHDPELLRRLCDRGLWLDHGRMAGAGRLEEVLEAYQASVAAAPRG